MKPTPEYIEGTEAFTRFKAAMTQVLAVPHAVIQERIEKHRKDAAKNPSRPGPRPKGRASDLPADCLPKKQDRA